MQTPRKSPSINFIRHLDHFYSMVAEDGSFNSHEIALYHSLFRAWNDSFFVNPFFPGRNPIIRQAGIRSNKTFYSTLESLVAKDLVRYFPPSTIFIRGTFCLSTFENDKDTLQLIVWGLRLENKTTKQILLPRAMEKMEGNFKIIPAKTQTYIEKKVVLKQGSRPSQPQPPYDPLNDPTIFTPAVMAIFNESKSHNHDKHNPPKQGHSTLRPPGIQPDPNADYSVPL